MSTTNEQKIILTVDPAARTLKYDGTLILGVKGDDCAQRIYFECPKYINEIIDDLTSDNITVFVDYKNAYGEPYIQECSDVALIASSETTVQFSWTVANLATQKNGDVSFNVCIKKTVNGILKHEWHTSPIVGKVLNSVDVSKKTPEVITHDTVTVQNLITEITSLKETLSDVNGYIDEQLAEQSTYLGEYEYSYFDTANDYLADVKTPGVYTFCKKNASNNSKEYFVLVVSYSGLVNAYYQSVFYNLTSGNYGHKVRYSNSTGWSTPTDYVLVNKADIEPVYSKIVSAGSTGLSNIENNFVLAMNVTRDGGTSTSIIDFDDTVLQTINYAATGTYKISIKGTKVDGSNYLLECSCDDSNVSFANGHICIVEVTNNQLRMLHSDYVTGSGDACYLVSNL